MIGKIKYRLRHLRASGKYKRTINALVIANSQFKSIRQWTKKANAENALRLKDYGSSVNDWVDFIWRAADGFYRPIQQPDELTRLIELVAKRNPKSVLEIGTANGGTLFLFCRAASNKATIVSIDLPGGINGGGYPSWKTPLYQKFAKEDQQLHLLRLNSHEKSSLDAVRECSPMGTYELIMIDADHSYEGVKRDFELYSKLVEENGIMILHDVIPNRFDPSIQVNLFWEEIKKLKRTEEIVFSHNQGNMGIGIVYF
ncbi:MAG: class I SAM-dependent methyltransferase [Acidiferrobacterales bacterium]|nr:class I SAM-dependent methyltransferase [Acidiferrobacterales bacterium]